MATVTRRPVCTFSFRQRLSTITLAGRVALHSWLTAVSAQTNLTSGGENTTLGGGNIVQQLKSAAVAAELIVNKKMFIIACEPSMTDPDTQCIVANLATR